MISLGNLILLFGIFFHNDPWGQQKRGSPAGNPQYLLRSILWQMYANVSCIGHIKTYIHQ
jgi:hypothetical protein